MYQVLARKYRPKNFHELLGQDHVAKALINAINNQRLHHAYLFTGTRGVGKTTIARILAKCLNCETGITSEPCGVCSICQSIDAGRFIDLIEIDAASRTKVEDTRDLLDNVPYAPTQGRYKVYLIDEVHMLSTHSFNALLKTLEEPPSHVKFLLATTDPQKLPITIISRCLQFVLRPLPQLQLADYLAQILTQEKIDYSADALWQLASSAKGSVRDALSLTDQAIAFGNGQISEDTIRQMLGLIDQADVIQLIFNIYRQNTAELSLSMQLLRQQVVDAKAVFDRLAEVLHQLAILQMLPDFDLQINRQQYEQLQELAQVLPAELLQLYYEIVVKSRENIALANTPMQALEMCILRLMAFRPLKPQQFVNSQPTRPQVSPSSADSNLENLRSVTPESNAQSTISNHVDTDIKDNAEVSKVTSNTDTVHQQEIAPIIEESPSMQEQGIETVVEIADHSAIIDDESNQTVRDMVIESVSQDILNSVETIPVLNSESLVPITTIAQAETSHDANQLAAMIDKNVIAHSETISPIAMLKPKQQQLVGEWTTEKWDYWVFEAREHGWLSEDEIVLAKRGIMTGQIQGQSQFVTDEQILSHSVTFENFCQKLQQHFTGIEISLSDTHQENTKFSTNIPETLQENREKLAVAEATSQLKQQPVTQALLKQNASISLVKLIQ